MQRKDNNNARRYTADELRALRRRGKTKTDWRKVEAMSEAELEASIAADPDDVHHPVDWTTLVVGLPPGKEAVKLRIDADVLAWFRSTSKGYQTRMNNVLRAFVESRRRAGE